jgi:hypothetical protein
LDCKRHEELSEVLDEYVPPNAGFLAASENPNRIRRYGSRCAAVAISKLGLRVIRGAYKVSPAAYQQLIQCLQRSLRLCSFASARY